MSLLGVACAEPDPIEPGPEAGIAEEPDEEPDERDVLLDDLDVLQATLRAIEDALEDVQGAGSLETAHTAAERALGLLLADGTAGGMADGDGEGEGGDDGNDVDGGGDGDLTALLPSETVERTQAVSAPDLLSATLARAQDTGGQIGREVSDVLRDPIAGDLGAWQRDAAGMVSLAEEVAGSSTDLETLEPEVLHLEGEGTRALAWTFVAREADELELAQGAAERGLAHVQVMRHAVGDVGGSS